MGETPPPKDLWCLPLQGCDDGEPLKHCPGMTNTEYRTEFSLWCIMGSSLLVATDIRNMTDIMKEVCDREISRESGRQREGSFLLVPPRFS